MHYIIMRPQQETDVRKETFDSYDDMHRAWNNVAVCESEAKAVAQVRLMFPDAVGFPAPVHIGSGQVVVLAMLEKSQRIDPGGVIPFVIIVQAVADNDIDKKKIKRREQYDGKLWRLPVIKPANGKVMAAELRGNELELPMRPVVIVGRERGRLVIYLEIEGVKNSIMFDDPRLDVYTSDAHVRVDGDGDASLTEPPGAA